MGIPRHSVSAEPNEDTLVPLIQHICDRWIARSHVPATKLRATSLLGSATDIAALQGKATAVSRLFTVWDTRNPGFSAYGVNRRLVLVVASLEYEQTGGLLLQPSQLDHRLPLPAKAMFRGRWARRGACFHALLRLNQEPRYLVILPLFVSPGPCHPVTCAGRHRSFHRESGGPLPLGCYTFLKCGLQQRTCS
jgi:hypothetical protein